MNLLYRRLKKASPKVREIAYKVMVRPIIEYAAAAWDPNTKTGCYKIEQVQRRAARAVFKNFDRRECVTHMVNQLGWASLDTRRREHRLCLLYQIVNGKTVIDKKKRIKPATYYGRNDHSHKISRQLTTRGYRANAFYQRAIKDWNQLDHSVLQVASATALRARLQTKRTKVVCGHNAVRVG
jgi:hypothetical protein